MPVEYIALPEPVYFVARPCPRCIKGAMFTRNRETSCFQCGHEIIPDYHMETTKAWLSARNND